MIQLSNVQRFPTLQTVKYLPAEARVAEVGLFMRCVTLPMAIEQGQQLAKALAEARPETLQLIDDMLVAILDFYGAMIPGEEHIKKNTRLDLVDAIVDTYPHLNVEEIALVFRKAKKPKVGNEGKIFGKINCAIVMQWFEEYLVVDGERDTYWEKQAKQDKATYGAAPMLLEALAGRVSVAQDEDGITRIGPKAIPIEDVSGLSMEERRAMAAEREAQEWREREAARNRETERRKKVAEMQIDTIALQDEERKRFRAFANKQYYAHLTTADSAILKAAEIGPLTLEQQPQYVALCEKWQNVLRDWEKNWHEQVLKLHHKKSQKAA